MKISNYYKESSYIHYSNCHEDTAFALQHISGQPRRILTIASALDNALAFLLLDPEQVCAFDFNETQIYLCNLKKCGIRHLEREQFLILLGMAAGDRGAIYRKIRSCLDPETRRYFDDHLYLITETGLVNCGRFEYYFGLFRRYILRFTHSKKTVDQFMAAPDLAAQQQIYRSRFNNLRFRLLFRFFFSKAVMKRLGRDKEFFKYAKGSLSKLLKDKFDTCVEHNLNRENPYLQQIVLGQIQTLPVYLQPENYEKIRQSIDRLEIKKISFEEEIKLENQYDFMYLSDIFEYMSAEKTAALSRDISDALAPGGQVLLYNMMIERHLSGLHETELDQTGNRTFYYTHCFLYEKD